jgi:adenine-specific DNA-methyltransferase
MRKQRLELTWIGKDERPRLEPRILLEDLGQSYHAPVKNEGDIFDNRLIFGDNLLALKALEQEFTGKVKCVFIDPPYNTGSAFEHYDDGVEHSIWLSMMKDRIQILYNLISEDGSLWVTLDDNEAHYFKVLADEIFGRRNFVANAVWQKKYSPGNNEKGISADHDHILIWAKDKPTWSWNLLPRSEKQDAAYKNPDKDPRGLWKASDLTRAEYRERDFYPIQTPSGKKVLPAAGRSWSRPPDEIERLRADNRLWFGPNGDAKPSLKRFLTEVQEGIVCRTFWLRDEVGDNEQAKKESKLLLPDDIFATPKPERLIERILTVASKPGDLILDSFAGSGTTGAVAHKMGRRWIMVELGEHCHTHIIPRLKKVIDSDDKGGVTEAVGWQGGGGFRYYRLAPSLLEKDRFGNWIIAKQYNPAMLAEAVCKLMGFTYGPSQEPEDYWRHGHSSEMDFIYVTTQSLTHDALKKLADEVGPNRTLLVCCKAFNAREAAFPNLTIKKIPHTVLSKCEWGRDDYSLAVSNLPVAEAVESQTVNGEDMPADTAPKPRTRQRKVASDEPSLFSDVEGK